MDNVDLITSAVEILGTMSHHENTLGASLVFGDEMNDDGPCVTALLMDDGRWEITVDDPSVDVHFVRMHHTTADAALEVAEALGLTTY